MNPPVGIPIAGSYDVMPSKDILDDFYARAIALSDGVRTTVIVSVDVCHIEDEDFAICRKEISDRTGIDMSAVIIVCTHTHAGGHNSLKNVNSSATDAQKKLILEYTVLMRKAIIESASAAIGDLSPAKLYFAKDTTENIINIRRFRMKDGTVVTNPGRHNPDVDHPLGEPNHTVKLIRIEREDKKSIYVVGFGMHATTVGWRTYLSSDYPGIVCRTLESALDVECMFLQGAAGDAVQINAFPSEEIEKLLEEDKAHKAKYKRMATYVGHKLVGSVLRMHNIVREVSDSELFIRECPMKVPTNKKGGDISEAERISALQNAGRAHELPYKGMALVTVVANAERILRMANEPDFYSYNAYTIVIGDLALVALPGEPFTEIGLRVESVCPAKDTVIMSLANAKTTYFPTTQAYSEGGYEVATTSVGPGTDDIIVNTVKEALKDFGDR
jgi:hypothetical protein